MKISWRAQELIWVTTTGVIVLVAYLWKLFSHGMNAIETIYMAPFEEAHFQFNIYRNLLLPDLGFGLLIYLVYLGLSLVIIPRVLVPQKKIAATFESRVSIKSLQVRGVSRVLLKRLLWALLLIVVLLFLLGFGSIFALYLKNEWLYHYPGFTFFPKIGFSPNAQIDALGTLQIVLAIILCYALYISLREFIINSIEKDERSNLIMVANQITLFLFFYLSIPIIILTLSSGEKSSFLQIYFACILPIGILLFSNIYWLFPLKGENSFFSFRILLRLLLSTFLCSLLFLICIGETRPLITLFLSWAIGLFIVTPFSWMIYMQIRDKIVQWRGMEKALVKSNANLESLRAQINPHFLFNTLNTLYGTALQEQAERTSEGIQRLGDMMRFMLHENHLDFIPMSREIEYMENFIALQKLRIQASDEMSIEDAINVKNCNYTIAPMMLIPFVENAFKHGISLNEKAWISISLSCDEKLIRLEVRNSIHQHLDNNLEKEKSGTGIKNLVQRLELVYPGRHDLTINSDGHEYVVQLVIQP